MWITLCSSADGSCGVGESGLSLAKHRGKIGLYRPIEILSLDFHGTARVIAVGADLQQEIARLAAPHAASGLAIMPLQQVFDDLAVVMATETLQIQPEQIVKFLL